MSSAESSRVLEFRIHPTNPDQSADDVRRLLDEAIQEAVAEASDVERARAEIPGAFAGVGETLVILVVLLGKAAVGGVGAAAGKHFYDAVLKPRLQRKNLVPSEAKERPAGGKEAGADK